AIQGDVKRAASEVSGTSTTWTGGSSCCKPTRAPTSINLFASRDSRRCRTGTSSDGAAIRNGAVALRARRKMEAAVTSLIYNATRRGPFLHQLEVDEAALGIGRDKPHVHEVPDVEVWRGTHQLAFHRRR